MTARRSGDGGEAVPQGLLAAAAAWHARMREPQGDPEAAETRNAAFATWLRADPRHRAAYDEADLLFQALAGPAASVLAEVRASQAAEIGYRPPTGRMAGRWLQRHPVAALAACLLLVVGLFLFRGLGGIDRMRSDLATAVGEQAVVTLADGSHVTLNTDTALAFDLAADRRQLRLFRGQALFDIAPDPGRPFIVETPAARIRVTGTRFDVRLDGATTVVSLLHGRVELSAAGSAAASLRLAPGEQAVAGPAGIGAAGPFDSGAVTAWLHGRFVFYDTPLAEVVGELNRYRAGRILIGDADLRGLRISGVFRTDRPDEALRVIAETLPVKVTRLTGLLVVLH